MRPRDVPEAQRLANALHEFEDALGALPGISDPQRRRVLIEQFVESLRRVRWVRHYVNARVGPARSDPGSGVFDPIKAAILHTRAGNIEEAYWLVFLFTHFGKPPRIGWQHLADIYGALGGNMCWDWPTVGQDVNAFRDWLDTNMEALTSRPHRFGNHRKYESLGGWSANGTGAVVASYVNWVAAGGNHALRFAAALSDANGDGQIAFSALFSSQRPIHRFGRVARFDYLSMVSKLELAPIEPDSAHLAGSTGPLDGARLLFDGTPTGGPTASQLEAKVTQLEAYLGIGFDPVEDGLCNWQKSPDVFRPFRG